MHSPELMRPWRGALWRGVTTRFELGTQKESSSLEIDCFHTKDTWDQLH